MALAQQSVVAAPCQTHVALAAPSISVPLSIAVLTARHKLVRDAMLRRANQVARCAVAGLAHGICVWLQHLLLQPVKSAISLLLSLVTFPNAGLEAGVTIVLLHPSSPVIEEVEQLRAVC
jgi:hypothetical protein